MPAPELTSSALATLTDKEIEILRLLTAGHTVKSIAVQLDRSEASINERLRDARRKTGAGSSRELARWIEAQKNCDRKTDLSLHALPRAAVEPLPDTGRRSRKGLIMFTAAIPAAALALIVAAGSDTPPNAASSAALAPTSLDAAAKTSPLAGTWQLDIDRIPAEERPQGVSIRFSQTGDGKWATRVEIVAADGARSFAESIAAPDGIAVPISGTMPFINTASLRQPAPNTLVMTLGKDGAPVSTRVYTVQKDGKTMTETIVWAGTAMPKLETTHFNRVG